MHELLPVLAVRIPDVPPVPTPVASDIVSKKRLWVHLPVTLSVVVKDPWVPLNALAGIDMFWGVLKNWVPCKCEFVCYIL